MRSIFSIYNAVSLMLRLSAARYSVAACATIAFSKFWIQPL
jgi:hypothetical protein